MNDSMALTITTRYDPQIHEYNTAAALNQSQVNVAIHITCVPAIMVTAFLFVCISQACDIPSRSSCSHSHSAQTRPRFPIQSG